MWIQIGDSLYIPKLFKVFNYPGCTSPSILISGDELSVKIQNSNLTLNEMKEYIEDAIILNVPIISFNKDEGWNIVEVINPIVQ